MYLAHIRQTGEQQTVREHCRNTAAFAAKALAQIGLRNSAYLAGLLHDMGKCKDEFAAYLAKAANGEAVIKGSVNHTFAGVRLLLEQWHCAGNELENSDVTAELLAYGVGAHHGLFDCVDAHQSCGFDRRLTKDGICYDEAKRNFLKECADRKELEACFQASVQEMTPVLNRLSTLSALDDAAQANQETTFYVGLLARTLLSAVIEGDRRDTAAFLNRAVFPSFPENMQPVWAERLKFMEKKLDEFPQDTLIDRARRRISDICADGARRPGGILRLNVPTGGGKTLASLRFALAHAKHQKKSRIIFTAPLLSILDQNAQIIRRFVGDDTLVLEHHSDFAEPAGTPERLQALELLTESWESPIIITTLVQLLNTCFSGKTSAIRRFHSLCNSIIVIDEVQTIPSKLLTLFNLAVNYLSEICCTTVVLCSATQPELKAAQHPLCRDPVELVPHQEALWSVFRRTEIQDAGIARLDEFPGVIRKTLAECGSLLVVCNTKSEAAFLFEQLVDIDAQRFHLSAGMCVEHRRQILRTLQAALDALRATGRKVVCISTQVIEAGVDISFQRVIRFSAGMDSVIQAAGRCNRHAEQEAPAPVHIIRCTDERLRYLEDIVRGQDATTALLAAFARQPSRFRNDLSSDEAIRFYYRQLYAAMPPGFQDDQSPEHGSLYQLLADNPKYADAGCKSGDWFFLRQAFLLAGSLFQVFDESTVSVLVPYGRGRQLQNALIDASQGFGAKDWEAIRGWIDEAKGYCVSIYHSQLEQLRALGAVTDLFDGSILLLADGFYDTNTGFSAKAGLLSFQEV